MLEAHYDDRIYFFTFESKGPKEMVVQMYNTHYNFVKAENGWINGNGNRFKAVQGLVDAIITTITTTQPHGTASGL